MSIVRETPGPGQESVWDYPRPPRLEPTPRRIRVVFNDVTIADTRRGFRVLETSHPPVYYIPPADILPQSLAPAEGNTSYCEWKGHALYYDVISGEKRAPQAAWYYPKPTREFEVIRGYVAFYLHPMDACYVDDERARPQPGNFYGGWITSDIVGPFKGIPGSAGW